MGKVIVEKIVTVWTDHIYQEGSGSKLLNQPIDNGSN